MRLLTQNEFVIKFLADELRINSAKIYAILEIPSYFRYKRDEIPKKNGGVRVIFCPSSELKSIQRKINRWLRRLFFKRLNGVHGFGVGAESAREYYAHNARDARWFFSFDIKNAFHSINIDLLEKILTQKLHYRFFANYQNTHAHELAKVLINLMSYQDKTVRIIPQDAPTSSLMFWMFLTQSFSGRASILSDLHNAIKTEKNNKGKKSGDWRVSLYTDNFLVYGNKWLSDEFREKLLKVISNNDLTAHKIKTQDTRHGSPKLCGYHIGKRHKQRIIVLPRPVIKTWRAVMHDFSLHPDNEGLRNRIKGFLSSVNLLYFNKQGDQLSEIPNQLNKPLEKIKHLL